MAAERDTGVINYALLHRSGDEPRENAVDAALHGQFQSIEQRRSIGRIQGAGLDAGRKSHGYDQQLAFPGIGLGDRVEFDFSDFRR